MNGYTRVTEQLLENKVSRTFFQDVLGLIADMYTWMRGKWPSRLAILNGLSQTYPEVFEEEEELLQPLSRSAFREIVRRIRIGPRADSDRTDQIADDMFDKYSEMRVLLLEY